MNNNLQEKLMDAVDEETRMNIILKTEEVLKDVVISSFSEKLIFHSDGETEVSAVEDVVEA